MWNLLRDPDGRPALTYGVVPEPTNSSCAAWLAAKCGNASCNPPRYRCHLGCILLKIQYQRYRCPQGPERSGL